MLTLTVITYGDSDVFWLQVRGERQAKATTVKISDGIETLQQAVKGFDPNAKLVIPMNFYGRN